MRKIRSFVRREGRLTPGQDKALQTCWPLYGMTIAHGVLDHQQRYGNKPVILEIGFGMGHSLVAMAQANPDKHYIGIEVHRPGVGTLFREMQSQDVTNITAYMEDAVEVVQQCIADGSLAGVQIYFPDPWHKKRHHKRRLIQPEFIAMLITKLKPGGFLHLATDWENYAEQMMEVLTDTDLNNTAGAGCFAERHDRPLTKFEQRGQRLGHGVWDLYFVKPA